MRFPQPLDRPAPVLVRHPILLEQSEVADAEDQLRPTLGQLVEGRDLLGDKRRVLEDDPRDLRAQPKTGRPCRSRRKERPHVLVVRLVGAVAAPEAELIEELERAQELVERLLGKQLIAEPHGR